MSFKGLVSKRIRAKEIMTDLRKHKLFVLVDVLCVVVGKRVYQFISELAKLLVECYFIHF